MSPKRASKLPPPGHAARRRGKVLIYLMRHDLRVADNPILHYLATTSKHGFTHLMPVYIFPCGQIEISGFLMEGETSPFSEARSRVGRYWKCGPHRAEFIAQSIWDLKESLEALDSGLILRVGSPSSVLGHLIRSINNVKTNGLRVTTVWMIEESSYEEKKEQKALSQVCAHYEAEFKMWSDEKYLVDDRDTGFMQDISSLPDVFTTYHKSLEVLREKPRPTLPRPGKSSLPPMPPGSVIPCQSHPYMMVDTLDELISRLKKPLKGMLATPPTFPTAAVNAHCFPFRGGETPGHAQLQHIIKTGAVNSYHETRDKLLGPGFSSKLSAYLAQGCITARQIHGELLKFEDGTETAYAQVHGYGNGENEGTASIRYQLLWRDYTRLCAKKYGSKLFHRDGFRPVEGLKWMTSIRHAAQYDQDPSPWQVGNMIRRLFEGRTGMGLIDANLRELFHTGYLSARGRQNVATFIAKMLKIDWRYGAEWFQMQLVDYDVASNWVNWQYLAGIGSDPRKQERVYNPVKQAFEYDGEGTYVRTWVPEVMPLERLENVFQVWTTSWIDLERHNLTNNIMVTAPLKKIEYTIEKPSGPPRSRPQGWVGGRGRKNDRDDPDLAGAPKAPRALMNSNHEFCRENRQFSPYWPYVVPQSLLVPNPEPTSVHGLVRRSPTGQIASGLAGLHLRLANANGPNGVHYWRGESSSGSGPGSSGSTHVTITRHSLNPRAPEFVYKDGIHLEEAEAGIYTETNTGIDTETDTGTDTGTYIGTYIGADAWAYTTGTWTDVESDDETDTESTLGLARKPRRKSI